MSENTIEQMQQNDIHTTAHETFFEKHKKLFMYLYRAVLVLTLVAVAIYMVTAKLFVNETDPKKYVKLVDLILAPNDTRTLGKSNYTFIIPSLFILIPGLYMCVNTFMRAYRRFHVLYVAHDEEHCATYKKNPRLIWNVALYVFSMIANAVISITISEGIKSTLFGFSTILFLASCFFMLWSFCIGYLLTDAVAKTTYFHTHTKTSHALPSNLDFYSIYKPDNVVTKKPVYYIYIIGILVSAVLSILIVLIAPMYHIKMYGVEFAKVSVIGYISDSHNMMASMLVMGEGVLDQVIAVLGNLRRIALVIGWLLLLAYMIVHVIPYIIMTLFYGMTYQDKRTIDSMTTFFLILSILLWVLTTSEAIGMHALDAKNGIKACWPSLVMMGMAILAKVLASILPQQFYYLVADDAFKEVFRVNDESKAYREFHDYKSEFVGPGSMHYYMNAFQYGITWNWCAFFLTGFWMAYRKMYFNAFKFFVFQLIAHLAFASILASQTNFMETYQLVIAYLIFILGVGCICGILGNFWYHKHVDKYVSKALERHPSMQLDYLSRRGGTSMFAAILYPVCCALFSGAITIAWAVISKLLF